VPVKFRRQTIAHEAFESCGVFDVDGDGVLDIVSGAFWYKGPDFRKKIPIDQSNGQRFNDYYDDFSTIALDIDGDGRLDFVTGGWWGNTLRWRQNPGEKGGEWPVHVIAEVGNVETTRAWDIDGDGQVEIVPNCPGRPVVAFKLVCKNGKGTGQFTRHQLSELPQGHGLGFGDIDNDGRGEIILNKGYLKAPAGDVLNKPWTYVEGGFDLGGDASVPVLVEDINGDGKTELIVGRAHSYGLDWWGRDASGKWVKHPIDPFNSQYHDLIWADIDGDGQKELITGKRFWAHCGGDAGELDDLGVYYFKWTGEGFAKQPIAYGPLGVGKGCGIHFAVADLRKTGRLDVVCPGKDGLVVFFNEGQ
jgi:hypothetical protein